MSAYNLRAGDGLDVPHAVIEFDESWTPEGGFHAEVIYECMWPDRHALRQQLTGAFLSRTVAPGNLAQYATPHPYPPRPNVYALSVQSISPTKALLKGLAASKWFPYERARLKVSYGPLAYDTEDTLTANGGARQLDPNNPILGCTQKVRASAGFRTLPEGKMEFKTSGATVDGSPAVPETQSEIVLHFPFVAFNPYQFLRPFLGTLNWQPMFGHGYGELILDSAEVDETASDDGVNFAATLTWLARNAIDWNELINDDGEYDYIRFKSTHDYPFKYINHYQMFGQPADFEPDGYPDTAPEAYFYPPTDGSLTQSFPEYPFWS